MRVYHYSNDIATNVTFDQTGIRVECGLIESVSLIIFANSCVGVFAKIICRIYLLVFLASTLVGMALITEVAMSGAVALI